MSLEKKVIAAMFKWNWVLKNIFNNLLKKKNFNKFIDFISSKWNILKIK